ncbi:alpha/beta hydrolase [Curtobacterium sp. MCPF17_002]|uniref:alpha/beta fold hydrolase n=1 Tax=Curtobacterium sp. MCPF17_002 TaxID=2175645 RepID=UPI0021ACD9B2|nr:alpha/beta hydrolase [Curtobacterium sp. MCPF17_002]WIB79170.1 alpha/beta hydrolase [Curtobacterium sp. MCPF17_002]
MTFTEVRVRSGVLDVSIATAGPDDGWPVVLLHGFPYDPRCFRDVAQGLAAAGARVLAPYLRGFGGTRFLSDETPRVGQQAAIGRDVLDLIDAAGLQGPILVGFDWGGRAACVAAALRRSAVGGLVALGGYSVQDIAAAAEPTDPLDESRDWYQYYFHGERGRRGLTRHRREIAEQLWREWSPTRPVDERAFALTAPSFENPDFVEVVIHSYRHRFGLAPGAAVYEADERLLAGLPAVDVPTIVLDPTEDPALHPRTRQRHEQHFTQLLDHRLVASGHNQPADAPAEVVRAVRDVHARLVG